MVSLDKKQQAVYGCLLGGAYGDALGLPYEGVSGRRGQKLFANLQRLNLIPIGQGYGMVSDDTEHAVMTLQAWINTQHLTDNQSAKFTKALGWKLRLWLLGLPAGIGMATGRALFRLWLFLPKSGVFSAGNGGAMRASILGVLCDDISQLKRYVRQSTELTHTDPKAYQGALVIALCAWHSYHCPKSSNDELISFVFAHIGCQELKTYLQQAQQATATLNEFIFNTFAQKQVTGYMYHTVPAVWFAYLRYRHQPLLGLQCLIRAGGDVDTTCAIAGGIWGVHYGEQIQTIIQGKLIEPKLTPRFLYHLSQQVIGQNTLAQNTIAQKTIAQKTIAQKTIAVRFGGIITVIRNLLFLLIVLLHGFRRLLPPY